MKAQYTAQTGLELIILLREPPASWDYKDIQTNQARHPLPVPQPESLGGIHHAEKWTFLAHCSKGL